MKCKKYSILLIFVFLGSIFFSCGDFFSIKKRIVGKYYLMETDSKADLAIYLETTDGNYIRRIPPKVLRYGFNDSFIVAESKKFDSINYYLILRSADSDYAESDAYLKGPLTKKEYDRAFSQRLKIKLKKVQ